jgi:hypothetical protein
LYRTLLHIRPKFQTYFLLVWDNTVHKAEVLNMCFVSISGAHSAVFPPLYCTAHRFKTTGIFYIFNRGQKKTFEGHIVPRKCCGAGPLLWGSGSGSSLYKISVPAQAPAPTIFPIYFRYNSKFFKIFRFFKDVNNYQKALLGK